MACNLHIDPIYGFRAQPGAQVTVFARSESGLARIAAAALNGIQLSVVDDARITFTIGMGPNVLDLVFNSPDPDEQIYLMEDCGAGGTQELLSGISSREVRRLTIEQGPPNWP